MYISLKEYALKNGVSEKTIRRKVISCLDKLNVQAETPIVKINYVGKNKVYAILSSFSLDSLDKLLSKPDVQASNTIYESTFIDNNTITLDKLNIQASPDQNKYVKMLEDDKIFLQNKVDELIKQNENSQRLIAGLQLSNQKLLEQKDTKIPEKNNDFNGYNLLYWVVFFILVFTLAVFLILKSYLFSI